MFYKIENKESEVYKRLHEMRTEELLIEQRNKTAVQEKIGLDYKMFYGNRGQLNADRVTQYHGFRFSNPEQVDSKIWKHDKQLDCYFPNKKTKAGREMYDFLNEGLEKSSFWEPMQILNVKIIAMAISYPFVEIYGDVILIALKYPCEAKPDIIEITLREFEHIRTDHKIKQFVNNFEGVEQ